jgi:regulator of replication initiation timing
LGGGGGGGGPRGPQQNIQQLLEEKRLLETNCRRLFDENKGLRFDNNEMIRRIRSQTEEGRRVRSTLESERKEKNMLREFSDKNQDDLIALRSETSRRCMEYESSPNSQKVKRNGD